MGGWKAALLCGGLLLQGCGGDPAQDATGAGSAADNRPPEIESVALEPASPRPGQRVSARVVADDPDGDPIRLDFRWRVAGRPVPEADGRPSLHVEGGDRDASIEVSVVASDGRAQSDPATASAHVGNLPPTIVQVVLKPLGPVSAGHDVTASPRSTDPDGGEIDYRYRWSVNGEELPDVGATLAARHFSRGDRIELEVVASDGEDESAPVRSPPIEVVNAAPRIVSRPGRIGADGVFRYAVRVEDPDGDEGFRYRLLKGPSGMSIDPEQGELRWTPAFDAVGSHPVEIEVEDPHGGRATQSFALELLYGAEPPPAAPQS
jgi:hypothetical protein